MKIGIDARFFAKAGPGRYTKSIIEHLEKIDHKNQYVIFLREEGMNLYQPKNENFSKVLAEHPCYSFDEQTRHLLKIIKQNLDLYYVPHFNIPVLYPKKIVTAIPDMTMHTYSTEKGTTLPLWYFKIKKIVYKVVFWWAVFRSYKVIVPSKSVLEDFLTHLKFDQKKYVLAYEGVDPDFVKKSKNPEKVLQKYGIKRNFLLSVGSMYEHKNVPGLIEMYKILKNEYGYQGQLVLASKKDKFSERIYEEIKKEGLENDILVLAFLDENAKSDIVVSDEEIVSLRMLADAYVMAAFKEGFSLTALEGMALGLPAALSNIQCHQEVYGDSAILFDPHDTKDMAEKVNTLLKNKDLREEYIEKGYRCVAKYDWLKTAKITLKVFEEAFKNRN